jgi:MOSC domain-containing protein YiiM
VYAYSFEHYPYWTQQLPGTDLVFGNFGENLTIAGLTEEQAHIGDQYRIGTSILRVTQPRMPCFKLALRFGRADMLKLFWKSGRPGIYFAIVQEGELGNGDAVELVEEHPAQVAVADVVRVYKRETTDAELYARVMQAPIAGSWKEEIRERWAQMVLTDGE